MSRSKYTIKFTPIATEDLEQIYLYISERLYADQAAKGLLEKIEESILQLKQYPFLGSLIMDDFLEKRGYRRLIINNYVVFYVVDETEKKVVILRVLNGRQKYQDFL